MASPAQHIPCPHHSPAMASLCPQRPHSCCIPCPMASPACRPPMSMASPAHSIPLLWYFAAHDIPCPWHPPACAIPLPTTYPAHNIPCEGTSPAKVSPSMLCSPTHGIPLPTAPTPRTIPLPWHPPLRAPLAHSPVCSLPTGTADGSVLNVARLPVLAHGECSRALRGRLKESELCTAPLRAGVGACEVSRARDRCLRGPVGAGTAVTPLSGCHREITGGHSPASLLTAGCWRE